jgi:hypothetical protein
MESLLLSKIQHILSGSGATKTGKSAVGQPNQSPFDHCINVYFDTE